MFQVTRVNRRTMLKTTAAAAVAAMLPRVSSGKNDRFKITRDLVIQYVESLSAVQTGYSWIPGGLSHLTATFAAVGCYRAFDRLPPRVPALAEFVRTHHPSRLKKLEQEHREFEFQQIQSLVWLNQDASGFRAQVSAWKKPTIYLKQYEQHGWPVFVNEVSAFLCRSLLRLPLDDLSPEYLPYLESRRRPNGSFNNTPVGDGSDGHVMNTWWGLRALESLERTAELKAETLAWIHACQLPSGGFTWQPKPLFAGNDDAAYTWAAVRALQLLGSSPANRQSCINYLLSLGNGDGGFGRRPGWPSNVMSTYFVVESLKSLGALDQLDGSVVRKKVQPLKGALPSDLNIYSVQIEAHGQGSPAEAVDLARSLAIHLWGAKNAPAKWISTAQALAWKQQVPVQFFVANEEYGTWLNVPGLGTYSHVSDIMAPPRSDAGVSLANEGVVSWSDFRQKRLTSLQKGGGRLVWQFGENQELVRLLLDDSLERDGYAAISTFHFGNPDFTNSEPFLEQYRGKIPFVALQDAHGEEPWWFADMTTGFRTVFLATEPTWTGWLNALRNNWVAAIRHDLMSGNQTWIHAGSAEVLDFVQKHQTAWRWWDNKHIQRPLVSIVAVRPEDEFEVARPERGISIRVRCAWENTTQGQPKKPIAELQQLFVDAQEVQPKLITLSSGASRGQGSLRDHYHQWLLLEPLAGEHTATAVVRVRQTNAVVRRTITFRG